MVLHVDSDASYLSELRARSRTGGHYYLSSQPSDPKKYPHLPPPTNGPIHTECRILRHVVCLPLPKQKSGGFSTIGKQLHQNTEAAIAHLLECVATNPPAVVQFKASYMVLHVDSDASYLSELRARSRTGGHYYLSSQPSDPKKYPHLPPPTNGPIHTECRILRHVVCLPLPKQKSGGFSTIGKQLHPYSLLSENSIFPNHHPRSKQITLLLNVSLPILSDKKGPRQWI